MKRLDLDEIKDIELKILIEIDSICRERNIDYSLDGGTLLGAIRHKGFIPWDDDIDILMTRKNYNEFIEYCENNKTGFELVSHIAFDKYGYLFAKAVDKSTILIEKTINQHGIEMGVCVDIFPVDYLGNSLKEAKKNLNRTRFLRELLVARNWRRYSKSRTRSIIYEPIRILFYILSRFTSQKRIIKKIERVNRKFSTDYKSFSGCICGSYREKEIMETNNYLYYSELEFEKHPFKVISNYDNYLTQLYGDYMQLPPKNQQITRHDFDVYFKDEYLEENNDLRK